MIDIETIQRLALVAVEKGDWDYTYRKICRWFSQTYSTSLPTVELDLDPNYVLQHYFEFTIDKSKSAADEIEAAVTTKESWDRLRSAIIDGYKKSSEKDLSVEEEDDNWAAEMAKILALESELSEAKKTQKQLVTAKEDPKPNLYDAESIFGSGTIEDTTPPDYD